jgi:hypothetical protein
MPTRTNKETFSNRDDFTVFAITPYQIEVNYPNRSCWNRFWVAVCFGTATDPVFLNIPASGQLSSRLVGMRRVSEESTEMRLSPYDVASKYFDIVLRGHPMTEPTYEELKAKLETLEKQADKKRSGTLEFRVGEKGGVSVYGLGRFPVTLYYEQWNRLLDASPDLKNFLEENKGKLKLKEG